MGPGIGYSSAIEQVIGQMPPNLQSVPGGGSPNGNVSMGVSSPPVGGVAAPASMFMAGMPMGLGFAARNPFAAPMRRY